MATWESVRAVLAGALLYAIVERTILILPLARESPDDEELDVGFDEIGDTALRRQWTAKALLRTELVQN